MKIREWKPINTKYLNIRIYFDKADFFVFSFTIIFSHDKTAIRKKGIYLSLLGFTFAIFKPQ